MPIIEAVEPPQPPEWLAPALARYDDAEDAETERLFQQHQDEADLLHAALAKCGIRPLAPAKPGWRRLHPAVLVEPWLRGDETWGVNATWKNDRIHLLAVDPERTYHFEDVGPFTDLDAIARLVKLGPSGLTPEPALVYQAACDSIPIGLFASREAARDACEQQANSSGVEMVVPHWVPDRMGDEPDIAEELYISPGSLSQATGYAVTPVPVLDSYDPDAED